MGTSDYIRHRVLRRPYQLKLQVNAGEGTPVLLLHGLASSSEAWKHLIDKIDTNNWQVIAFDLLGFGDSPKPNWPDYNVGQHALAVVASLKKLKLKQPVILVGHSMGCLVAVRIAKKYPKLVRKVILYEPPLYVDLPEYPSHVRNRKRYFALYQRIADNPKAVIRYASSLGKVATRLPGHNLSPETWLPFERSLRNTIMGQTAYTELLDSKIPVEIIHGRLDMIVGRTQIRKMLASNPYISFHMVNDSHTISGRAAKFILSRL